MPCQNLGGDIILFLFWVATLIRLLIDLTLPLFLHLFHSHSSLSSHSTLFSPLLFLFPLEFDSFFLSIYVTLLFISYSLSLSLSVSLLHFISSSTPPLFRASHFFSLHLLNMAMPFQIEKIINFNALLFPFQLCFKVKRRDLCVK